MRNFGFIIIFIIINFIGFAQVPVEWVEVPESHLDGDKFLVLSMWQRSGTKAFVTDSWIPKKLKADCVKVEELEDYDISPESTINGSEINRYISDYQAEISKTPTILQFPSGIFPIEEMLELTGNVILKGKGGNSSCDPKRTEFSIFLTNDLVATKSIKMSGNQNGIEDIYIRNVDSPFKITETPDNFEGDEKELVYKIYNLQSISTIVKDQNGNVVCSGDGEVQTIWTPNRGIFKCDATLENNHTYKIETSITIKDNNITSEGVIKHTIIYKNSKLEGIADSTNKEKGDVVRPYTIYIAGTNNWVKGIESYNTQKMHVYIAGRNNTVSGCYFHHSYDYGGDGNAFGVCMSTGAERNLVEDNVFYHLRHAVVCQYDSKYNVIGYNSSFETLNNYGYEFKSDMTLHGGDNIGPNLNLFEGNINAITKVDAQHDRNGPYNTFFRNRAIYHFKISWVWWSERDSQYAQNVVGCNMDPWTDFSGSTKKRLTCCGRGFISGYGNGDEWKELDSDYKSYYLKGDDPPAFYSSGFDWPFVPARSNVNPARHRWNTGGDNCSYTVFQGRKNYLLEGALFIDFTDEEWNNVTEDYIANEEIIFDNSYIHSGNTLTFKAGEKVVLTNGTKISVGNNVNITSGEYVCSCSKKQQKNTEKLFSFNSESSLENSIELYPNPNNGSFSIQANNVFEARDIHVFGLLGKELRFHLLNNKIKILDKYQGMVLVYLLCEDIIIVKKIIIYE